MKRSKPVLSVLMAALLFLLPVMAMAGETLDAVKGRGYVQAGVNGALFGFGMPDEKGVWRGLDVDTARAVAAAIFGDPEEVKFVTLTTQTRFTAMREGNHWLRFWIPSMDYEVPHKDPYSE